MPSGAATDRGPILRCRRNRRTRGGLSSARGRLAGVGEGDGRRTRRACDPRRPSVDPDVVHDGRQLPSHDGWDATHDGARDDALRRPRALIARRHLVTSVPTPSRTSEATWASASSASSSCLSSRRRSSCHTRRPSRTSSNNWAHASRRTAGAAIPSLSVRLRVIAHGSEPIECHQSGCCLWHGRESVGSARRRLFEESRGQLPASAKLESACGRRRCVNVDHLHVLDAHGSTASLPDMPRCQRGHDLTAVNVVRHRDGRVAYCRQCRNARRRERYAQDEAFARRERRRQRLRRASTNRS